MLFRHWRAYARCTIWRQACGNCDGCTLPAARLLVEAALAEPVQLRHTGRDQFRRYSSCIDVSPSDRSARVDCAPHLGQDVLENLRRRQNFCINTDDWTPQRKGLPLSRE
jgi:hypothetical protein